MTVPATRLLLVRHAPTTTTRRSGFPADEELDVAGTQEGARLATVRVDRVVTSPARRCRQTAEAAGWPAPGVDPRWSELDFGAWAGSTFDEVFARDPDRLLAWQADPVAVTPPHGESLADLARRVARALDDLAAREGRIAVVSHGGPIRVAVLLAVGAPVTRLWHVDVAPGSVTELVSRPDDGWCLARLSDTAHMRVPARKD